MQTVAQFSHLKPGDTLGVIATGAPCQPQRIEAARLYFESLGFKLKIPLSPSEFYGKYTHGFSNYSAEERAEALINLFKDPTVKAIFTARGAYGSMEILELLDYSVIQNNPKPIIGFSDVTSLLLAIYSQTKLPTIHGSTFSSIFAETLESQESKDTAEKTISFFVNKNHQFSISLNALSPTFTQKNFTQNPPIQGTILCGNLTTLLCLVGTKFNPSYDGAILCLEDKGESPYRIHRGLMHLKLAGLLDNLSAIVLGRLSNCQAKNGPSLEDVINTIATDKVFNIQCPIFTSDDFGHDGINLPIPIGVTGSITRSSQGENIYQLGVMEKVFV